MAADVPNTEECQTMKNHTHFISNLEIHLQGSEKTSKEMEQTISIFFILTVLSLTFSHHQPGQEVGVVCLLLCPDLSEEHTMLTMLQLFSLLVSARSLHSTGFVCVCPSWQQMEKQCVDALAKLNAVIMILEGGRGGGLQWSYGEQRCLLSASRFLRANLCFPEAPSPCCS